MPKNYYVVDTKDQFVLYFGTLENCLLVQEESYAGLTILSFKDLTPKMKSSLASLRKKEG